MSVSEVVDRVLDEHEVLREVALTLCAVMGIVLAVAIIAGCLS